MGLAFVNEYTNRGKRSETIASEMCECSTNDLTYFTKLLNYSNDFPIQQMNFMEFSFCDVDSLKYSNTSDKFDSILK